MLGFVTRTTGLEAQAVKATAHAAGLQEQLDKQRQAEAKQQAMREQELEEAIARAAVLSSSSRDQYFGRVYVM